MVYKKKLMITEDGSHSIELVGKNEQYHSTHGAIQESQHVFIENGLKRVAQNKRQISILEVGMGTALNVLLSYIYAQENKLEITYHALEPFPVEEEIWTQLNYTRQLGQTMTTDFFNELHSSKWEKPIQFKENFTFIKEQKSIIDIELIKNYDLIYFDAFNPDLEAELWKEEVFKKIYSRLNSNGLLSTYSTKGIVKRAMKSCGFKIEKKPGPPGKREILNALKETI